MIGCCSPETGVGIRRMRLKAAIQKNGITMRHNLARAGAFPMLFIVVARASEPVD